MTTSAATGSDSPDSTKAQIGVTGLAVMGSNIARNFARNGYTVALHNRSVAKTDALLAALVCTIALMSCTDEDAVVSSSPDSVNAAKMTISGGKAGGLVNRTRWTNPRVLEGDSGLGA